MVIVFVKTASSQQQQQTIPECSSQRPMRFANLRKLSQSNSRVSDESHAPKVGKCNTLSRKGSTVRVLP